MNRGEERTEEESEERRERGEERGERSGEEERGGERRGEEERGGEEGGRRRTLFITGLALSWTKTPVQQSGKVHRCYLLPREGGQSAPNLAVRIQNRRTLGAKRSALIFCSYLPTKDLLEEQVKA